jgi:hypothetical protein
MTKTQTGQDLVDSIETITLKDITDILNRATELLTLNKINLPIYLEVLIKTAYRCDQMARDIYSKEHEGSLSQRADLEEYRSLLDIARECRDAARNVVMMGGLYLTETT